MYNPVLENFSSNPSVILSVNSETPLTQYFLLPEENFFFSRYLSMDLLLCQNDRIVYPTTVLRLGRPIERYLEKKKFSSGSRKYCVSGVSLLLKITLGLLLNQAQDLH